MTTSDEKAEELPLSLVLQLEEVCGRFEAAWQTSGEGDPGPRIEDHLATAPEPGREALARDLVRIDIAYRRRAGQAPAPPDYLSRFPHLKHDWLDCAFAVADTPALPATVRGGRQGHDTANDPIRTLPASAVPLPPVPSRFGDFELLGELGRGGMGVVFKARQVSLNRIVALKMILDSAALSEEALKRFHREAQAAASLDHPNIVPVHASGQQDGRPFFTMAYVEGENLRDVVHRDGMPLRLAVAVLRAVAEAVAFAHRKGVVHRDLKPDNVLLDVNGRPRVTDFGLACRLESRASHDRLTRTWQLVGTPAYMSPEQALSKHDEVGPATDVYSLGGILYYLLTGQPPFQAPSLAEVLFQVTTRPPTPPSQINPRVPAELEAVCLRCLEKDPARRYPSAEALVAALREADAPRPVARENPPAVAAPLPPPPRRRWASRVAWVAAALALALVVTVAWLTSASWWPKGKADAQPPPPAARLLPPEKLRTDFGLSTAMLGDRDAPLAADADGVLALRAGDSLRFKVKVSRAAYVGIWSVNDDGSVLQLFPNLEEKEHHFRQDEERVVPKTPAYAYDTEQKSEYAWVWVQASTRGWDPDEGQRVGPWLLFKADRERGAWERQRGAIRLRPPGTLSEAVLKFRVGPP